MNEQGMMGVIVAKEQYSLRFIKDVTNEVMDIVARASLQRAEESYDYMIPKKLKNKLAWYKRQSI
jgi:hypothetical protein